MNTTDKEYNEFMIEHFRKFKHIYNNVSIRLFNKDVDDLNVNEGEKLLCEIYSMLVTRNIENAN